MLRTVSCWVVLLVVSLNVLAVADDVTAVDRAEGSPAPSVDIRSESDLISRYNKCRYR